MVTVSGDSRLQSQTLEDLAEAVNYRSWLVSLALPYLGDDPLEVGSGHGDYAADWAAAGVPITASEADASRLALLTERFAGDPRVRVRELAVPIAETGSHSAVVAYNVLEHIEDDVAALRSFAGLVRPGGHVILVVPAFEFALGRFDRLVGHFRRYRCAGLRRVLVEAGLEPVRVHYVNAVGLFGWTLVVRILGGTPKSGPLLRVYDRFVVPVLRRVEARLHPPFGQSVFAVARTRRST